MNARSASLTAVRCGLAATVLFVLPACGAGAGGEARLTTFHPQAQTTQPAKINKAALLHPKHKYYGVFTPTAPARMDSIDTITQETGKQPNMDLYFQAWDAGAANGKTDFNTTSAKNACGSGLLPLYTWESWDAFDRGHNPGSAPGDNNSVLWWQPKFAPAKIIAGKYDVFIRRTAKLMSSIGCPIALRFDQEPNGYWYPWGFKTAGAPGTPTSRAKQYVQMWRHVWNIFQKVHASNVLWVWSPNFEGPNHTSKPTFAATYPGPKYVDWVGMDGYYYNNDSQTFKGLFGPTIKRMKSTAPNKPWLVAETGVGTGPDKPQQISNLLNSVAARSRFNGFVYFDQYKAYDRSDWRFDAPGDKASLHAFKVGVNNHTYANGKGHSY